MFHALIFSLIANVFLLGFYLSKNEENKANEEKVKFYKRRLDLFCMMDESANRLAEELRKIDDLKG